MNSIDNNCSEQLMEPDLQQLGIHAHLEGQKTAHNILVELADYVVDFHASSSKPIHEGTSNPVQNLRYSISKTDVLLASLSDVNAIRVSYS